MLCCYADRARFGLFGCEATPLVRLKYFLAIFGVWESCAWNTIVAYGDRRRGYVRPFFKVRFALDFAGEGIAQTHWHV